MFALFAGEDYYPIGGYGDWKGTYSTLEKAQKAIDPSCDWYHIVNLESGEIYEESN